MPGDHVHRPPINSFTGKVVRRPLMLVSISAGRAYAALDGDISPMHLYKATAMLMGFPSPVANVHLLAARAEASIATNKGEHSCSCFACSAGDQRTGLRSALGILESVQTMACAASFRNRFWPRRTCRIGISLLGCCMTVHG